MNVKKMTIFQVELNEEELRYISALITTDINGDVNFNTSNDRELAENITDKEKRYMTALLEGARFES